MNMLKVEAAKTETSPGEFVTDGYAITVAAEGHALDGQRIYGSQHANKAWMKAGVLTADERFEGFAVTIDAETAEAAGKANLTVLVDASRLEYIRSFLSSTAVDVDVAVEAIKVMGGNNVVEAPTAPETDADPTDG